MTQSFASSALRAGVQSGVPGHPDRRVCAARRRARRSAGRPTPGSLLVTSPRVRHRSALAGYFAGKADDSTFLSDGYFGNSMLLPNHDLDAAYQKIDLSGVVPDPAARAVVCQRREPVQSELRRHVWIPGADARRADRRHGHVGRPLISSGHVRALHDANDRRVRVLRGRHHVVRAAVLCIPLPATSRRAASNGSTRRPTTFPRRRRSRTPRTSPSSIDARTKSSRSRKDIQADRPSVTSSSSAALQRRAHRRSGRRAHRHRSDYVAVRLFADTSLIARGSQPVRRAHRRGAERRGGGPAGRSADQGRQGRRVREGRPGHRRRTGRHGQAVAGDGGRDVDGRARRDPERGGAGGGQHRMARADGARRARSG